MSRTVSLKPILTLVLALLLALSGCAWTHFGPTDNPNPVVDDSVAEVLEAIDVYRADGEMRSISDTRSDDPVFMALDDQPSTAAVRFGGPICRIGIGDVLLTALKNNQSIRIEDYNRSIAEEAIEGAWGVYDLMLGAGAEYNKSKTQEPMVANPSSPRNSLSTSQQRDYAMSLSLSQLLPSGAIASMAFGRNHLKTASIMSSFFQNLNPYDTFTLGFSITQPLLRGFGPFVTNAPIRIARLQEKIAREDFRNRVIQELTSAIEIYWDLVYQIDNYEVQRLSLERAEELLRSMRIKVEVGTEAPDAVIQAEAEVASREAMIITTEQAIADVSDALKRAMHISEGSEQWGYNLVPSDTPSVTPVNLSEEMVLQEALRFRPDYRSSLIGVALAEVSLRLARNSKLPQLDATASYNAMGLEDSSGAAFDNLETLDFGGYGVGLTFNYPLQNRSAEAGFRQAELQLEKARKTVSNLDEIIHLEVRTALRQLESSMKRIKAYDAAVKANEAKLDSQQKRYDVGYATIFEVLDFQEDLAAAESNYVQAVVDYNKAIIQLQRVKASFLQDFQVEYLPDYDQTAIPEADAP